MLGRILSAKPITLNAKWNQLRTGQTERAFSCTWNHAHPRTKDPPRLGRGARGATATRSCSRQPRTAQDRRWCASTAEARCIYIACEVVRPRPKVCRPNGPEECSLGQSEASPQERGADQIAGRRSAGSSAFPHALAPADLRPASSGGAYPGASLGFAPGCVPMPLRGGRGYQCKRMERFHPGTHRLFRSVSIFCLAASSFAILALCRARYASSCAYRSSSMRLVSCGETPPCVLCV